MDFMEYYTTLIERIELSVQGGHKNGAFVNLAELLFYIHGLYEEKQIDKNMYYKVLNFYEDMHKLLLSQEDIFFNN